MSDVTTVTNSNQQQYMKNTGTSQLDKNAFLELLITQLRYQDPLNPTDNGEFLAQMAQFSSLEQMQNINDSLEKVVVDQPDRWGSLLDKMDDLNTNMELLMSLIYSQQSAATDQGVLLLNKIVTVQSENGQEVTGKVSAVKPGQTGALLVVADETYSISQVVKVHGGE